MFTFQDCSYGSADPGPYWCYKDVVCDCSGEQTDDECIYQKPRCENWGIARMTHEGPVFKPNTRYYYEPEQEADIYILDSGIRLDHEEFEGRAMWGWTGFWPLFVDSSLPDPNTDNHGHGTSVAGAAIGRTYGTAKRATAVSVKVLSRFGTGWLFDLIYGTAYAVNRALQTGRKSVINLSVTFGGEVPFYDFLLDIVVTYFNIPVVIAAGSWNRHTCTITPARSGGVLGPAITVAATDRDDYLIVNSNYGNCTDVLAPGVCVRSAYHTSPVSYRTWIGSSQSAPLVAGIIARYIAVNHAINTTQLKHWIAATAVPDKIHIPEWMDTTPNLLVQSDCYADCFVGL